MSFLTSSHSAGVLNYAEKLVRSAHNLPFDNPPFAYNSARPTVSAYTYYRGRELPELAAANLSYFFSMNTLFRESPFVTT